MNQISYGQMLAASLDTLKHLKTNLIENFDKERLFTDYWNKAPGLQDCREFEEFVESYHRDNVLRPFSSQNLRIPANSQAISSALLASALSTKFAGERDGYNDHDIKMLRAHVSVLSSSGFLGHAMTLQKALVTLASVYDTDGFYEDDFDEDEEWNTLIKLKDGFQQVVLQILFDAALSKGFQLKIPLTVMNNPLPIPEELVWSWPLDRFRKANWEIDCLGRTLGQIALDEDRYFSFKEYSLRDEQDILGRSDFHIIYENTRLKRPGSYSPHPVIEPSDMEEIRQKNCTGQQLLHYAAVLGNLRAFKYLLSLSGIEADCPDVLGRAPVFYAASNGHTKILRLLLDQGNVIFDREDNKGYTPLCIAAYNRQLNAIECLLENGADANHVILPPGLTLLAQAMLQQDIDLVRFLGSQKNIDVNCGGKNEPMLRNPLAMAIVTGFQEGAQYLLSREDIDVNKRDYGGPPLYLAIAYGLVDTARLLAAHPKVNVNLVFLSGLTALTKAAIDGPLEIVEILLAHPDIDVNLADSSGRTPLIVAALYRREEVIRSLLRHPEVDLGLVDSTGNTAVGHAQRRGPWEIAEILRKAMFRSEIDTVCDE
jgi:ankyrin repeat protein